MSTKDEAERLAIEHADNFEAWHWDTVDVWSTAYNSHIKGYRDGEKSKNVMRLVKTMTKLSSSIVRPVSMHDACHMLAEIEKKLDSAIESFNASPEEK